MEIILANTLHLSIFPPDRETLKAALTIAISSSLRFACLYATKCWFSLGTVELVALAPDHLVKGTVMLSIISVGSTTFLLYPV